MALFGSIERRIRPKAGTYVAWSIPGKRNLRETRSTIGDLEYAVSIIPIGTISMLKRLKTNPDRLKSLLDIGEADRLEFDESLLPKYSWECTLDEDEYEVEKIVDVRSGRRTRFGRSQSQYLVQ